MASTSISGDGGASGGGGGDSGGDADDRVLATAHHIIKSLSNNKEAREDMLQILSSFDNRLSTITSYKSHTPTTTTNTTATSATTTVTLEDRFESSEEIILRYDSNTSELSSHTHSLAWEDSPDEVAEYLSAIDEILISCNNLSLAGGDYSDRADTAIQLAMSRLEDEFRHILIRNTVPLDADRLYGSIRRFSLSFASNEGEIDEEFESFGEVVDDDSESRTGYFHERGASIGDDLFVDLINPDAVIELREIADRMIRAGYEMECSQVYSSVRREALDECLAILGVEKLSIEEVQKMEWNVLNEKMKKWIQAVKIGVRVLLSGERRLCEQVFDGADFVKSCFDETVKGCVMQLLNFGEAVSIAKRSPEKLFRILDMYDALADVMPDLEGMVLDEFLVAEAKGVLGWLAEAAMGTFAEFEFAVQNEASRKPMHGGDTHPLTRYVMNYLKLLADYRETMNALLDSSNSNEDDESHGLHSNGDGDGDSGKLNSEDISSVSKRLLLLLSSLESNLEEKSRLYEDGAMQYVFLMNNILYIVQKVKDSELVKLLGDDWVRKRRGKIRQYATGYLRASWTNALSCLKDEGIGGSSTNAAKPALKERFKNFNACFEEIYRVQTAWKVPDEQLREELRISISEKVIPAYRSFLGRFGNQLEGGRHSGKYIKYTPEDLENYLSDLFEGSPNVLHHLRRKNS